MVADIPNAFVQTDMVNSDKDHRIIMKIRGQLVDMLVDIDEQKYKSFVNINENGKILYVVMKKALYGMLQSALLYYKNSEKISSKLDLRSIRMTRASRTEQLMVVNIRSHGMLMTLNPAIKTNRYTTNSYIG